MDNFKLKVCAIKECGKEFKQYNSLMKYCSPNCKNKSLINENKSKYQIPQVSKKRKIENLKYQVLRKEFLDKPENKYCFIDGCNSIADTIEHTRQRVGYADDWARENNVTLFLDVRYWKPCCLRHNLELENNPELASKYKLSKFSNEKRERKQ